MAAGRIVLSQYFPARDRNGQLVSGALLTVYTNGTTTKASIYAEEALTTPLANPVAANSSGQFPAIWASDAITYTLSITGPDGESIGNPSVFDNYSVSTDADTASVALAEAAATAAESALADALAISASGDDAAAIAARAKLDGSNFSGSEPAAFRTAIGADLSSNVNFTRAGTGAVVRSVQDVIADLALTPEEFGAAGDGATDDGVAIQAAIDAAATLALVTGRKVGVRFGDGKVYLKSIAGQLKANVHLFSDGTAEIRNTVAGMAGFANATGARIQAPATGIVLSCASGITGTIGWDLTDVGDCWYTRVGVLGSSSTNGFLIGVKLYSTTSGGAYRTTWLDPLIQTQYHVNAVAVQLDGTGTGQGTSNGHRFFGGNIRSDLGTNVTVFGDGNSFFGVMMEGTAVVGVDITASALCTANLITGCRFEGVTSVGIRFGLLTNSNAAVCNHYTTGVPTKVSDLSLENVIFEPSHLRELQISRGHFRGRGPLTTTEGVFDANLASGGHYGIGVRMSSSVYPLWGVKGAGRMGWGPGSGDFDIGFLRVSAGLLRHEIGHWEALLVADGITAPSATVGKAKIYVDSADGDLKVIFGDGTVKTIITDT